MLQSFFVCNYEFPDKQVFVPGKFFQPSQMFVSKARSLIKIGAPGASLL
jgi:hypothetical protein